MIVVSELTVSPQKTSHLTLQDLSATLDEAFDQVWLSSGHLKWVLTSLPLVPGTSKTQVNF